MGTNIGNYKIDGKPLVNKDFYRRTPYQSYVVYNKNLAYTWDSLIGNMKSYLQHIINNVLGIDIPEIELINSDPSYQRTHKTGWDLIKMSQLPRGVLLDNYSVSKDNLVVEPNNEQAIKYNSAQRFKIIEFNMKDLERTCPFKPYDWFDDFNFCITSSIKRSTSSIFFTLLFNTRPETVDAAKLLKLFYPLKSIKPVYALEKLNPRTGEYDIVPYYLRAEIPDEIIIYLKKLFKIDDDQKLCELLQKYSDLKINYTVDGATRKRIFSVEYPLELTLVTEDIDDGNVTPDNNTKVYGVKIEFSVNYIEFPIWQISTNANEINLCNPDLYVHMAPPEKPETVYLEIPNLKFHQEINGTVMYESYEIEYSEEDQQFYPNDENPLIIDKVNYDLKVPIKDITNDIALNRYIDFVLNDPKILNISVYLNIEVKRLIPAQMEKLGYDTNHIGTDPYIEVDYNEKVIFDTKSKVGDHICVAVFVNKEYFNRWKIDNGYAPKYNLTDRI